jgi:hypothetical protein
MSRDEIIERAWALYVVAFITTMCFGAGYIHITGTEKYSTAVLEWILTCFLFSIPPNFVFFILLTVFKKNK